VNKSKSQFFRLAYTFKISALMLSDLASIFKVSSGENICTLFDSKRMRFFSKTYVEEHSPKSLQKRSNVASFIEPSRGDS